MASIVAIFLLGAALPIQSALAFEGWSTINNQSIDEPALFRAVGAMYSLDPGLLEAIAMVESSNNAAAVSPAGAMGLMQLMPSTAWQFNVSDPFDPIDNTIGAARFLSYLRSHQACQDLPALIAAYNAGVGAVQRYRGIPPYAETRDYVRRVLWLYLLGMQTIPERTTRPEHKDLRPVNHSQKRASVNYDQAMLDQLSDLRRRRTEAAKSR
jgi:soluble lytic murein transglycosylase-like protein